MVWITVSIGAIAILVTLANAGADDWAADVLRSMPAPTKEWADIVGHLAWPATVIWLIIQFRETIASLLSILLGRLETDDLKTPIFELTRNSAVLVLDPADAPKKTGEYGADDVRRIEALLEFVSELSGFDAVSQWLEKNFDDPPAIEAFVTEARYVTLRERAFNEIEGLKP